MTYRVHSTGQYPITLQEAMVKHPNVSFGNILTTNDYILLDIDPVLEGTVPAVDAIHIVQEIPPVQDTNGNWIRTYQANDITVGMTTDQLNTLIAQLKASKIADLANFRYSKETGGVVVGGANIATDRGSQSLISGAYSSAKDGVITSFDFKAQSGWATLTAAQMIAIGQAVATHVQACFTSEKNHTANINALTTPQQVVAYNYTTGWPT